MCKYVVFHFVPAGSLLPNGSFSEKDGHFISVFEAESDTDAQEHISKMCPMAKKIELFKKVSDHD